MLYHNWSFKQIELQQTHNRVILSTIIPNYYTFKCCQVINFKIYFEWKLKIFFKVQNWVRKFDFVTSRPKLTKQHVLFLGNNIISPLFKIKYFCDCTSNINCTLNLFGRVYIYRNSSL